MMKTRKENAAVDPLRLTKFFDQDKRNTFHQKSGVMSAKSQYSPEMSWDGLSVNPKPFARFDESQTMATITRPNGMAGPRVIELEGHGVDGIFGHNPVGRPIPRTDEQKIVQFTGQASHVADVVRDPSRPEGAILVEDAHFRGTKGITMPVAKAVVVPEVVKRAGPQADQALLTPAERRELMEFEKQRRVGERLQKKAEADKRRLVQLMLARHPQGVLHVDSLSNPNSEVYGERCQEQIAQQMKEEYRKEMRRQELKKISEANERIGYNPFQHNEDWEDPQNKMHQFLQTKAGRTSQFDTHDRIFGQTTPSLNPKRTENIRNQDLGGKQYNLVTGTQIVHGQPTVPERIHNGMAHPSQQRCERGRNEQGALTKIH